MSYADGWAAMNLEMPSRVPRSEFSAFFHWKLVEAVTGIHVDDNAGEAERQAAMSAFVKAWNYDFVWNTLLHRSDLGEKRTKMGHATYVQGGVDFDNNVYCPFEDPEDVIAFDPLVECPVVDVKASKERFELNYRQRQKLYPDTVSMTGSYVTCISGLIELFGWDMLLMAAGIDPKGFGEMTNRYCNWVSQHFNALAESNIPVVMIHDDIVWTSGAFLHPDWYREYVFPNYKKMFAPILESGKRLFFTSDGNYTEFIDDIAACGVHGFVMEPTVDMAYIAEKYGKTHVFVGNADTRILLSGTKEEIRGEVKRCMDIGKNCPGFFMAVGNHIPSNTPVENALYYQEVYEELSRR